MATESDLHIFCDGPKSEEDVVNVNAVREFCKNVSGFRSVTVKESFANRGLANSIIDGVTNVCQDKGQVIVVEDDLVTSPYFLRYMNDALELYRNDPEVASVHGYIYDVPETLPETFFIRGADCWGWGTWKRGWDLFNPDGRRLLEELETRGLTREFDFDGTFGFTQMLRQQIEGGNDSWAIRWYASAFLKGKLTLYPGQSLVHNIGTDASGVHCAETNFFSVELADRPVSLRRLPLQESKVARSIMAGFLRRGESKTLGSFFRKLPSPLELVAGVRKLLKAARMS